MLDKTVFLLFFNTKQTGVLHLQQDNGFNSALV